MCQEHTLRESSFELDFIANLLLKGDPSLDLNSDLDLNFSYVDLWLGHHLSTNT